MVKGREGPYTSAMILKFEGALKAQISKSISRVLFENRPLDTYVVETTTSHKCVVVG